MDLSEIPESLKIQLKNFDFFKRERKKKSENCNFADNLFFLWKYSFVNDRFFLPCAHSSDPYPKYQIETRNVIGFFLFFLTCN